MQLQVLQKWCMCYRRFILFQCTRTRLVKRITRGFCLLNNLSTWTLPPDRIVFGFFLVDSWEDSTESWHCPFTFVITQARPVFVSLWAWAGNEHKPNLQDCLQVRFLVDSWEDSWHCAFTFMITQARPVFVSILYLSATYLVLIGNSPD